jgi:hypothetical protein
MEAGVSDHVWSLDEIIAHRNDCLRIRGFPWSDETCTYGAHDSEIRFPCSRTKVSPLARSLDFKLYHYRKSCLIFVLYIIAYSVKTVSDTRRLKKKRATGDRITHAMPRRLQKQTWAELRRLFVSGWSLGKLAKRFAIPKGHPLRQSGQRAVVR